MGPRQVLMEYLQIVPLRPIAITMVQEVTITFMLLQLVLLHLTPVKQLDQYALSGGLYLQILVMVRITLC